MDLPFLVRMPLGASNLPDSWAGADHDRLREGCFYGVHGSWLAPAGIGHSTWLQHSF